MPFIKEIRHSAVALGARVFDASLGYRDLTLALVAVTAVEERGRQPAVGYGISPIGWYAPTGALGTRMIPRLLEASDDELLDAGSGTLNPLLALETLLNNEPPGSDGERSLAVASLEMALWDLAAKLEEQPLCRTLSRRFNRGRIADRVDVTAAGGFYRVDVEAPVREEIARLTERGYRSFEMRVGAALPDDLEAVGSAIAALGDARQLAVNASCALDADRAAEYGSAFAGLGLRWFAEPGNPLDFEIFEELTEVYEQPLASGGRLFSFDDIDNLLRYSALRPEDDLLILDPAACGFTSLLTVRDMLPEYGWQARSLYAAGGQPLFALHVASGLELGGALAMPDTFGPFGDLGDGVSLSDGRAALPDAPGVGFETHAALMDLLRRELQ